MNLATQGKSKLSRRDFLRVAGLAGGAILLSACTPASAPAAQTTAGGSAATEQVTISWWNGYQTDTVKAVVPQIIGDFEKLHPNIKVTYEISGGPPGGGQLGEVLLSRIAAGNPPETVTLFDPPSQYGALGSLVAIDDMMASATLAKPDSFYEGVLGTCKWQGKTYGLPASAACSAMFMNKTLFEQKGISTKREDFPKTWDELKKLSADLTVVENDEVKQGGYVPPWSDTWLYPVWSNLNGGKLFDAASGKYIINSDENKSWVDFWAAWIGEQFGGSLEKLSIAGNWNSAYPPDSAYFNKLEAVHADGSWIMTDVDYPFEWEVAKFPVGPSGKATVTGFWPNWFAIPKGSPHPNESFLFIEYFSTKGWETWYKAIMDTPAWKGISRDVITQKLVDKVGRDRAQELHNFFTGYLADTATMWDSPVHNFVADTLKAAIEGVLSKTKTTSQALDEAQQLCQSKLEETLKSKA